MNSLQQIQHELGPLFSGLAQHHSKKSVLDSDVYRRHHPAIERAVTSTEQDDLSRSQPPRLRDFVRVVAWNIERGMQADGIAQALNEHPVLRYADVLLLTETDLGMGRSQNRNVARFLADALNMRYFYATSYLNLSPGPEGESDCKIDNTLALQGNAILSRHPFSDTWRIELPATGDKMRGHEKRLGTQTALGAQLTLPGAAPLVSVCTHLDAHSSPAQRKAQLATILDNVETRAGAPILVGGDWNTNGWDANHLLRLAAMLVRRLLRDGIGRTFGYYYANTHEGEDRILFQMLTERGYDVAGLNEMGVGTQYMFRHQLKDMAKITSMFGPLAPPILAWEHPWREIGNDHTECKLDWFTGRGLAPLRAGQVIDGPSGMPSVSPHVVRDVTGNAGRLSDHDPIVLDLNLQR